MIPIHKIKQNQEAVIEALTKKHFKDISLIDTLIEKDEARKNVQKKLDDVLFEVNSISKEVGNLFKQGKAEEAEVLKNKSSELKSTTENLSQSLKSIENEIHDIHIQFPNIPHESVPKGKTAEDNTTVRSWGTRPILAKNAVPHWDLASKYDLFDLDLGSKLTGAGFPVFKGKGAKLQRALAQFFLDENTAAGYQEIIPPLMVNEASAYATGQLPDKEGQMYIINEERPFYMIPTAEVPVTNIYRDKVLSLQDLPVKLTAFSQCFRREAGSYGKDVRGLNRVHQFDKVEIVQLVNPENSYQILEEMTAHVEGILQKLGLEYRVLLLCGGDMSFASAKTYDLEVYSAAQEKWLEVSSVSNFEDFQTNRLKARYKDEEGKTKLCHSLNGSALALPRIYAAILENYQTEDGIKIPDVLVPYTGFNKI